MQHDLVFFKINGKLEPLSDSEYKRVVSGIKEGDKVSVSFKSYYREVENSQMNLFYFYCRTVADETGSDFISVSEGFKIKFGIDRAKIRKDGSNDIDSKGNLIFISQDIRDYNVRQMSEFLMKIHAHITSELGIIIPDKKELTKLNF